MKQLALFGNDQEIPNHQEKALASTHWKMFIDGASRNNPGPSGAGVYILKNSELFFKKGYYLFNKTNNQAEYLALLLGLFQLQYYMAPGDTLMVISDSQLLVRQINGEYKIKNPVIVQMAVLAKQLLKNIDFHCMHVLRLDNKEADSLANQGIDEKEAVPEEFVQLLQKHLIPF